MRTCCVARTTSWRIPLYRLGVLGCRRVVGIQTTSDDADQVETFFGDGQDAVFKGGDDPNANIMIYEVDIPGDANHQALRRDLREKALELSLDISIQHKLIFEAINRV